MQAYEEQTPSKYEGSFLKNSVNLGLSAQQESAQRSSYAQVSNQEPRVQPDQDLVYLVRDYFEPILELESGTELLKTELAMRKDFTLAAAFNQFSRTMQAKIPVEDFLFALDHMGLIVNPRDV